MLIINAVSICANYLITIYGSSVGDSGLNNKISLCTGLSKIDVIVFMVTLHVSSSFDGKTYMSQYHVITDILKYFHPSATLHLQSEDCPLVLSIFVAPGGLADTPFSI